MKVFISHQRADSAKATEIARRLRVRHDMETYLDVIDTHLNMDGEDLGDYIREQMSGCTHLLAVISYSTKLSQWVPWEIGVATEKDLPLATYADAVTSVPEFIQSWPILRTLENVDDYAKASRSARRVYTAKRAAMITETASNHSATKEFYRSLRANL